MGQNDPWREHFASPLDATTCCDPGRKKQRGGPAQKREPERQTGKEWSSSSGRLEEIEADERRGNDVRGKPDRPLNRNEVIDRANGVERGD